MAALYDCSFPFTSTVEEILERVAGSVPGAEAGEWIRGGQWAVGLATLDQSISAELGAVPELAPILWYPVPGLVEAQTAAIGRDRAEFSFPIRSLVESGAEPAYGSDWPAVVPTPNPWPGVEALLTRQNPYLEDPQEYKWAEQAVDLETALEIMTINGAKALKVEDVAGSIEVGKSADLIVLDQNVFEIPVRSIADTQVLTTIFEGRTVHDSSPQAIDQ